MWAIVSKDGHIMTVTLKSHNQKFCVFGDYQTAVWWLSEAFEHGHSPDDISIKKVTVKEATQ